MIKDFTNLTQSNELHYFCLILPVNFEVSSPDCWSLEQLEVHSTGEHSALASFGHLHKISKVT